MEPIHIVIPGVAVPQLRSLVSRFGKAVRLYTPEKSKDYKDFVKLAAAQVMNGASPLEGALRLDARAYLPIPVSLSKKKYAASLAGEIWHIKKPDCDNLLKNICDGMSKIVCRDDAQFSKITIEKFYSDRPRVEVTITPLEQP